MKALKNGKIAGLDEVTDEMINSVGELWLWNSRSCGEQLELKFLFLQKFMQWDLNILIFNPNLVILLLRTLSKFLKPLWVLKIYGAATTDSWQFFSLSFNNIPLFEALPGALPERSLAL